MPKRTCHFKEEFTKEWTYIKKGRTESEALCSICNTYISIQNGGKTDIYQHIATGIHKSRIRTASSSQDISTFMVKKDSEEEVLVAVAELTTAYKVVRHQQSFNSLDCTTKLNTLLYPDSKIASKQTTARTKATAIVKSILAPHSVQLCVTDLNYTSFFGIATDASNHNAEKMFPLLVQFFDEKNGQQCKLLKLGSLNNERSETITEYCKTSLENLNIPLEKLIAFCGDNTNTNFGGLNRGGSNNVFSRLNNALGRDIEGVGCPAHVLHNTLSTAADVLTVDVESIVVKIFKYFHIYTVRTEKLKDFCDYADVSYKNLLSYVGTRWLSLLPAVERILKMWEPLKDFFNSEERPPKAIKDFFDDPISEAYFCFLHSQLNTFESQIRKVEKSNITVLEVKFILQDTKGIMMERKTSNFIGMATKQILNRLRLDSEYRSKVEAFEKQAIDFFDTAVEYITKWSKPLQHFNAFDWMSLKSVPAWDEIEQSITYLQKKGIEIGNTESLFNQFIYLKDYLNKNIEKIKTLNMEEKWVKFFGDTEHSEQKSCLIKMCEYVFSIPAHNANVERMFSLMTAQWTNERNRMSVETIESILICHFNYKMTCAQFYEYIKTQKEVIAKVKASSKYDWAKK